MYHAATKDLYPTCFFTNITTHTSADKTTYIHFSAGFGKRKIRRTETNPYILTIHFFYKKVKCLFQISEGNILINIQSLYLVKETMASRTHGFIPVHTTGHDHADGKFS